MDARRLLQRMCARHGLALQDAIRLLPLIERALLAPQTVRDRILALVEHNLTRKAEGARPGAAQRPGESTGAASPSELSGPFQADLDAEILVSVARVLHAWTPSAKLLELGRVLPDLFPPGFSFDELTSDEDSQG